MEYPEPSSGRRELTLEETIQSTKIIDNFDYIYGNITKTTNKTDLEELTKSLQRVLELQEDDKINLKIEIEKPNDGGQSLTVAPIKKKYRKKEDLKLPDLRKG